MEHDPVILFDGVCNLCNSAVVFIIRRDKKARLKFAALQSEAGLRLLRQYQIVAGTPESVILLARGKAFQKSGAVLRVCRYLSGGWPLMLGFIIVPAFLRDLVYDWVARHRYKWFGNRQECMVPTPLLRKRFLE